MLDALTDPAFEEVVFMTSAQIGKTLVITFLIGFHADQDPANILVVFPTLDMAEAYSKEKLTPFLRETPCLNSLIGDPRSRDSGNKLLTKTFARGTHLAIAGGNSPASLSSRSRRIVIFDEVDKYEDSAGTEGDPVNLGKKRARTYWNKKFALCSTPNIAGHSRIESAFEDSDQRYFFVPCPHCGFRQVLKWGQVRYSEGPSRIASDGTLRRSADQAWYECESAECEQPWTEAQRHAAVRNGEWRAMAPGGKRAGFHIWAGYSAFVGLHEIASEWLEAQGKPEQLKIFVNSTLGETWKEKGDAPESQRLFERAENYPIGKVPRHALFLTAGVDVQKDRIEASIYGWGRGKESWLIDHIVLDGSPTQTSAIRMESGAIIRPVWGRLTELLNSTFRHESGADLSIMRLGIDSGYSTNEVYAWVRQQGAGRVLALDPHGRETAAIVGQPSPVDVTVGGKKIKRGVKVWPVAVSRYKSEFYGWLRMDRPEADIPMPGYCHFPQMDLSFFKQITNEQLVQRTNKAGYRVSEWQKTGPNEALDCRNYARACAAVAGIDRFSEKDWLILEAQLLQKPTDPPPPTPEPVEKKAEESAQSAGFPSSQQGGWFAAGTRRSGGWFQR